MAEGTSLYHVHADHLGRPIRMTDAAKATVWQATWKPWGEPHAISGSVPNTIRFPGQYFQLETNLHYNHHRHYDPVTGRYTQPDPLRFIDGPSVYAYAGNSPYMYVDREGQWVNFAIGAAIGVGIELLTNKCATAKDLIYAAAFGAVGGGLGGKGLVGVLKGLSNRTKGRIGEGLAIAKNRLKGLRKIKGPGGRIYNTRARRDAQYTDRNGNVFEGEAKFGTSSLTSAQREAQRILGDQYIVDKFTYPFFGNVGATIGGTTSGALGASICGC